MTLTLTLTLSPLASREGWSTTAEGLHAPKVPKEAMQRFILMNSRGKRNSGVYDRLGRYGCLEILDRILDISESTSNTYIHIYTPFVLLIYATPRSTGLNATRKHWWRFHAHAGV